MSFNIIYSILIFIVFIIFNFYNQPFNKEKQNIAVLTGKTMGTYWQVKIPNLKNKIYIKNLIQKSLNQDEKMLSSWEKDSIVSQFNKKKKTNRKKLIKIFLKLFQWL